MTVLANTLEPGGSAGYIALLIVVLLFVATFLLIRNMSGRLKRLPKQFPPPDGGAPTQAPDGPASPRS